MTRRIVALAAVASLAIAPAVYAQGNSAAKAQEKEEQGIKHRVDALEDTVEALQAALEGVDLSGLGALQDAVDALSAAVAALTTEVGQLADSLGSTQADVAATQTDIDALQTGLNDTQQNVVDLQADVAAVQDAIDALGSAGPKVVWSGGCTVAAASASGVKYCANGSDFLSDTALHLDVNPLGTFTVLKAGLYRISFWTLGNGTVGSVRLDVNGATLQNSTKGTFLALTNLEQSLDVSWRFAENETFDVWVASNAGNAYRAWAPGLGSGAASRLQVEYLGE